jgi:hypothetical protein
MPNAFFYGMSLKSDNVSAGIFKKRPIQPVFQDFSCMRIIAENVSLPVNLADKKKAVKK